MHIPVDIDSKAIREKLELTQTQFAARFGFSVNTLRHWEQGKRQSEGPTRAHRRQWSERSKLRDPMDLEGKVMSAVSDEKRKAEQQLESLLLEGITSEELALTQGDWASIRKEALVRMQRKQER